MLQQKYLSILLLLLFSFGLSFSATDLPNNPEISREIQLLEKWLEEIRTYYHIPGIAVGIVYDRDLIWSRGFGYADLERQTPVTPKTLFRIASISKLFTSTAIMQLRDQNRLALDEPIKKYLPWFTIQNKFENAPEITIRHLLTHTSGLPGEAAFPYWTDRHFPTLEQIKQTLPQQEMTYAPETKWKYSNLGMALLGEIVVQAGRQAYADYIHQHILQPLNMRQTLVVLDSAKLPVNMAVGYLRNLTNRPRPKALFTDSKGLTPAANLTSNVEDLARFCSLQFRTDSAGINPVLKPSTLREMQRIQWLYESWTGGWGLGFSIRKTEKYVLIGHAGWVSGYRSQILFTPKEKVAVIVLINTDDYRPYEIARHVLEQMTPAIQQATQPSPVVPKSPPEWRKYVGPYVAPDHWQTDVMLLNHKLYLYNCNYPPEMEPADNLTELVPEGQHTFRMSGANGNGEKVVFFINEQQQVVKIKVGENYIFPKLN